MKIIGINPSSYEHNNRFIVDIGADELIRLAGHSYAPGYINQLRVGTEVNICSMYDHLDKLSKVQGQIDQVRNSLLGAAKLLDGLPEPLKEVKCGPDKEAAK